MLSGWQNGVRSGTRCYLLISLIPVHGFPGQRGAPLGRAGARENRSPLAVEPRPAQARDWRCRRSCAGATPQTGRPTYHTIRYRAAILRSRAGRSTGSIRWNKPPYSGRRDKCRRILRSASQERTKRRLLPSIAVCGKPPAPRVGAKAGYTAFVGVGSGCQVTPYWLVSRRSVLPATHEAIRGDRDGIQRHRYAAVL